MTAGTGAAIGSTEPDGGIPPVWVLHGQPDSSATWWPARAALLASASAHGHVPHVRLLDRPGYGHNREPARDYPGNVTWLRAELDRAGVDRVVLVGHSWGGGVAILAAAQDPRVVGLALLASVGPGCLVPSDQAFRAPGLGSSMSWVALGPGATVWRQWLRRRVREHIDPADVPYARSTAFANRARPVWRSFLTEQRALLHQLTLVDGALGELAVPTLVVTATDDSIIPTHTGEALVERIAGAEAATVTAGHDLNLSAPDATGAVIADWLLRQRW